MKTPWILTVCFIVFALLSWVIVFRDPRAMIGISNLYPALKDFLFSTQLTLSEYGLNSLPTILFAVVSVIAFSAYIRSLTIKISLKTTLTFSIGFLLITFFSFPVLSTDIFSYIFSERVATVHGENIWQIKPAAFPDDQFGVLADWKDTINIYGAMHYLLYLGPSLIGGEDLLSLVILYKLVPIIFAIGTLYILYKLLKLLKSESVEKGIRLVFWNPLFVLEIFGSGHNDSMMIFFTLLSYYLFRKRLWIFSGIALALGVQVKLIPVVLFAFCLLTLLRKKLFIAGLLYFVGFVVTNVAAFAFMQVNVIDYLQRVLYNGGVYWQSLQNIIRIINPEATAIITYGFLLSVLVIIYRHWKLQPDPLFSYAVVILVYLLFVSTAYWNWYILWVLPLLPFITDRKVFLVTLIFSFTSLMAYPLLWVIHRINTQSFLWPVLTYIFIFLPPMIIYVLLRFNPLFSEKILQKAGFDKLIAERAHH